MLEIFIPTLIKKQKIEINNLSNNFVDILKKSFSEIEITNFESTFFS